MVQTRTHVALGQPSTSIISVTALTKRYGKFLAVDDLTFALKRGTVTGFLGPNGAGKSTVLRVLLGLAEPTTGEALIAGRPYRALDQPSRMVGAALEPDDFDPARSGINHLRTLALAAQLLPARVDEVLALVGLTREGHQSVGTYSLGMRQRLGIAGALLGAPQVLVLDEPANGLDPAGVQWLRTFLRRFAGEGGSVMVASHALTEIAQTADQVIVMDRGRLIATFQLDDLRERGETLEDAYLRLTSAEEAS